jgi:uncharacterized protein (TIGR01319 family)
VIIDVLVAEIGSTTTIVNAFDNIRDKPRHVGQGVAPTSVDQGDVNIGLKAAIGSIRAGDTIEWREMFASSSAAGGLRMTVHGLVYDMTVRAAREAALGSGAVLAGVTAGRLTDDDLRMIQNQAPKMILLAGGVDYGERETALFNFKRLLPLLGSLPLIYAGNCENRPEIARLAAETGAEVTFTENVYPSLDRLNVVPARRAIQAVFERHIVHAPGMTAIRDLVDGPILPTPGAVMAAAELAYDLFGDTIVFDVGGATTDVHSVTAGSDAMNRIATAPEPFAKRTVEGDLGIYVNRRQVKAGMDPDKLKRAVPDADTRIESLPPIPKSPEDIRLAGLLTGSCLNLALERHAGRLVERFMPGGRILAAEGRDLTAIKTIIGTGGALSRLPLSGTLLADLRREPGGSLLYPPPDATVLIDRDYIMSSLGVLAERYPDAARLLLRQALAT